MKTRAYITVFALIIAASLNVALADGTGTQTGQGRPNLTGNVQTQSGQPIQANVFIATAGPKTGTSPFCPSCYADCRKSAKADANGKFEIDSLDPQLRFQVLVVAKGYKPKYVKHVDPVKGPITVTLSTIEMADAPPGNCLYGRVVDIDGKPVVGAVVEANGIQTRNGGGMWGTLPDVDPLAVTDEKGEFLITSKKPFDMLDVSVSDRSFANKKFTDLASGSTVHVLTITEGATVQGRVLFHGQPVTNAMVGMVSVDRTMEHFTGNFDIGTDSNGRFMFINLPPNTDYYVYSEMSTFKKMGATPLQTVHAGKDGETTDVGDLVVGPAYRLSGHVVLSDGAPIPPKTRLLIGRERAWDNMQVILGPDGRFDIQGVPAEAIGLHVQIPGYRVSAKNASLDRLNPYGLVGRVEGDLTNLIYLMEKGDNLKPDYNMVSDSSDDPSNKALHGAEAGVDHSYQLAVSGNVTDKQTGEPLKNFKVTPGRSDLTWNRNYWDVANQVECTNGNFQVYVDKKWPQSILKVEADGYLPSSVVLDMEQTKADLALQKGTGPGGYVVTPDGKPVANADVLLICDDSDQPGLGYDGHFNSWRNQGLITQTAADGHFALAPQLGMRSVAVAATNGFAIVPFGKSSSKIVLQPFGTIKGVLNRPTGLGTNEDLDVAFSYPDSDVYHRLNLSNHALTDAAGRFEFDGVPSGKLLISYRLKMNEMSWQNISLQQVSLEPGQTLELNIQAPARQTTNSRFFGQQPPKPVRIAGQEIKGVILLPNGKPAADAEVAIRIKGQYLALGRGELKAYEQWQEGSIVRSGPDGAFTLPLFENAQMVIALNDSGFAQVTLDQLKRSPKITLQAWGGIEGTLKRGHHFASGQIISISDQIRRVSGAKAGAKTFADSGLQPLMYDSQDFQAMTDKGGHFLITYVPPGEHSLFEMVPVGSNSRMSQPLGDVDIKPGKTAHVSYGGGERTVTGRVTLTDSNAPVDFSQARLTFQSGMTFELLEKMQQAKSPVEQKALYKSKEFQHTGNPKSFFVQLNTDGSFKSEDMPPGKYEVSVDFLNQNMNEFFLAKTVKIFMSPKQVVVPPAASARDDSAVDLGAIQLQKISLPIFKEAAR